MNNGILAEAKRLVAGQGWSRKDILNINQTADLTNTLHGLSSTTPGTANTKTSWADLVASTPYDSCVLILSVTSDQVAGSGTGFSLDVATGGAGSEVVLIDNILQYGKGRPKMWWFPLRIAAGTRLAYRYQYERTTGSMIVGATLIPDIPEFPSGTSVVNIGPGLSAATGQDGFTFPTNGRRKVWQFVGSYTGRMLWALPNPGIRTAQTFITSTVSYLADWGWTPNVGGSYGATVAPPDVVFAQDFYWRLDTVESQVNSTIPIYLDPPLGDGSIVMTADVASGGNAAQNGPNCYGIMA